MGEKANGMNRINKRIYTDAQTSPMLSGLLGQPSAGTRAASGRESHAHRCAVHLQQVPAFQIGLHERWTQRRNEIDGREEREDGESKGDIERRQWWDGIDQGTHDEPSGQGYECKEQ
jgi:hypothetical protein